VIKRYLDAYQVAAGQVGLGDILKKVGIGLGIVLALVALSAAADRYGGGSIAFFGLLGAGAVSGVVWSWGNSLAAQGQVLRATLDTARYQHLRSSRCRRRLRRWVCRQVW